MIKQLPSAVLVKLTPAIDGSPLEPKVVALSAASLAQRLQLSAA